MRLIRRCEGWNERTARLFACDCAERVLPIFEKAYPADKRPRQCIETARKFANGKATLPELERRMGRRRGRRRAPPHGPPQGTPHGPPHGPPQGAAAWAAAWAAWDAARAAAGAAARAAERKWQTKQLLKWLK